MEGGAVPAMLRVPVEALREVVGDVRAGQAEKKRLAEELAKAEHEVQDLERKLAKRQVQLDKCVAFRSDVRSPRRGGDMAHGARRRPTDAAAFSSSSVYRNRSRSELFSSSIRDLIGEQTQEMTRLAAREENLRVLMEATREISQTSDYLEVVSRALRAAHATVDAEKYTLGILNEKKDAVELFSNPPIELPGKNYMEEGDIPVDSTTTFGRVVLTGKPLEVRDVGDSDLFELFEDQLELLDFEPDALLCTPIFNVHGILVGVFQVITRKHQLLSSTGVPIEDDLARPSTPLPATVSLTEGEKESFAYVCTITGTAIWNVALARAHQTAQGRIECLIKLNRNISAEVDAARVLDQIVAVSYELLGTEKIALYVRDEGSDTFYNVGHHPSGQPNTNADKDELLTEHNGIAGYVMRSGQLVLTNSAREHPEFDASYDAKASFNTRQVLCAPVKDADSNILAVICASNKIDGDEFTPEDALYLNYVADGAGIAMHKSNLLREVVTSQQLTEARLKLAGFVATSASIAEFVGVVTEEGEKLLGCDRFGLLLVDHLKKELWISQLDGQNVRMPLSRGISGLVATTGETICTRDAYTHELFDPSVDHMTGYRTTSVLCMPVLEDHAPANKPKIVAVAMAINKLDSGRVVPFTTVDATNMTRLCREIQFALGRLTLDISFFKVVSDCGLDNSAHASSSSSPSVVSSSDAPAVAAVMNTDEIEPVTETQIISSLVHKYCQPVDPLDISLFLGVSGDAVTSKSGDHPPSPPISSGLEETSSWQSLSPAEATSSASAADSPLPLRRSVVVTGTPGSPSSREGGSSSSSVIMGIGDVDQWDFNCLDLSNSDVSLATSIVFRALGLFEAFRIASDKFSTFLSHVATHYRANPFHNLQHAFQVTHTTFSILKRVDASLFSPLEKLSMLLAALCHDIDHPGNNNDFEVKARSQMALTHNDDAVLERHHCRVTFIILSHAPANVLENLSRVQFARARRLIITCILATDMGKHFDKCKVLEALTVSSSSSSSSASSRRTLMDKKPALLGVLLHAADLSAQALPYAQAVRWGMRMLTEFQNQARHEAELHVHVESFMANLHQVRTRITVQMNFINYVLRPVWLPLASLFPDLRVFADALENNFDRYRADLDKLQSESVERPPISYVRGDSTRMLMGLGDGKSDGKSASKFGRRDSAGEGARL